jgi:rod shape-determining protein MreD
VNLTGFVRVALVFALLVLLHYTVRPLLGGRAPLDFLVIAVLIAAVRLRPGLAALLGLAVGIVSGALAPTIGPGALALSVVAYAASWLKAIFFADNVALSALFFFVGKWTFDVLYLVVEHRLQGAELVMQLLLWSPLAATLTALTGVLLLLLLRPVLGRSPG